MPAGRRRSYAQGQGNTTQCTGAVVEAARRGGRRVKRRGSSLAGPWRLEVEAMRASDAVEIAGSSGGSAAGGSQRQLRLPKGSMRAVRCPTAEQRAGGLTMAEPAEEARRARTSGSSEQIWSEGGSRQRPTETPIDSQQRPWSQRRQNPADGGLLTAMRRRRTRARRGRWLRKTRRGAGRPQRRQLRYRAAHGAGRLNAAACRCQRGREKQRGRALQFAAGGRPANGGSQRGS